MSDVYSHTNTPDWGWQIKQVWELRQEREPGLEVSLSCSLYGNGTEHLPSSRFILALPVAEVRPQCDIL